MEGGCFFFFPRGFWIISKCWLLQGPRKTLGETKKEHAIRTVSLLNVTTNQWLRKKETCYLKTSCSCLVKPRSLKQQLSTREKGILPLKIYTDFNYSWHFWDWCCRLSSDGKLLSSSYPQGHEHSVELTVTVHQAPTCLDIGFAVGKETFSCHI